MTVVRPANPCLVWVDHHLAHIFERSQGAWVERLVPNATHQRDRDHDGPRLIASTHATQHYFHDVAKALANADSILIVGPGVAKRQFMHHLNDHDAAIAVRVVAIESVDHPTDGQAFAYARRYFDDAPLRHEPSSHVAGH